jgi:two-component system sensor histidine kinase VicK
MKNIRFFQSIQSRLVIIYVLLILIAMQLFSVYFNQTLESYFKNDFLDSNNKMAYLVAQFVGEHLAPSADSSKIPNDKKEYEGLNQFVNNLFAVGSSAEIQVIDADGIVRSTTDPTHESLVSQKNTQTEVTRALQGVKENQRIFTDPNGGRKLVIAKPIGSGVRPIGAVYIVASMENMYGTINKINQILITGTLIALGLTAFLGIILSSTITRPIQEITRQATAIAEGNFSDFQVKVHGRDEISQLARTFNEMMNRLKDALSLNEEEKEKLASILTNMNEGVIAADESGRIILMNVRAQQMLHVDQLDGNTQMSQVLSMTNDQIMAFTQSINPIATIELEDKDEEEHRALRITFTPIQRRPGGSSGTIAVLQDVTEQEKLEHARRDFVANVSHELRTPLTTIKSYLEALSDGAVEEPDLAHRFIGVMRNESERMIRLVSDLLHLSRLDSNKFQIVKEQTDIAQMLDDVVDRFSFQLKQRQIQIYSKVDPALTMVMLDQDKIDQVLDNLISNAIKYTGDTGSISIHAQHRNKDWLEISVQDTGIGIPKKDISHIFDRFYRVDKARSRNMGGTGLGLSIAREIVKAHGGSINLESELNKGTKVTFTLPLRQESGDVQ